jgi:hypothetical protein
MKKFIKIIVLVFFIIFIFYFINKIILYNLYKINTLKINEKFENNNENIIDVDLRYNKMYKIISLDEINNMEFNNDLKNKYTDYFEVQEIINPINNLNKAITVSFFCQNTNNTYPNEFESPDHNDKNSEWYNKYYLNLLKLVNDKKTILPEYKLRIYLENKLAYLKDDLINDYTEIYLMKNNSVGANPGALWRFIAFDDKSLDIAFSLDIDEDLINNIKYIKIFEEHDKTFGRFLSNHEDDLRISKNDNNPFNYPVVMAGISCIRPKKSNISFIHYIVLFMLLINRRFNSDKKWSIDDNEELTIYNKPFNNNLYCWGCNPFIYGFDEKVFKHIFFPYFAKKGEILTFTINDIDKLNNLPNEQSHKIDYDFVNYYNNLIKNI